MKSLTKLMLIGVSVLVLGAFACSSEDEPTPTSTLVPPTATTVVEPTAAPESIPAPTATTAPAATATPTAEPEAMRESTASDDDSAADIAKRGGIFRLIWGDPPTLDPAQVSDGTSFNIVLELFSGLVKLANDPVQPVVLDLAESYTVSEDGTVYRFVLREGLVFSDGSPLTAFDVKWSWERAAHPDTASSVVSEFLGDIIGIKEIIEGEAETAEGIQVIDDQTLQVTIDAPKPYFIAKLTYPTAFVVNRENIESGGDAWTDSPVGTGPFKLKSYEIGNLMVLERNERYWGTLAYLDEVHYMLAGGSSIAMYENDEIDVSGIPLAAQERVEDPNDSLYNDRVDVPPGFFTSYIAMNVDEPPFDDVHFRRALNFAVDKQLISDSVLSGRATPARGPLPPGFVGHNPDLVGLEYDEEKAKEELAMSQYADADTRPRIILTTPGTGGSPPLWVQAVLDMWNRVLGVTAEVQEVEWATFLEDLDAKRLQIFNVSWSPDYPDPVTFVDVLFRSDSALNHTGYASDEVDALLAEANTETDPVRRIQLYQEAEQIIVDEASWIPMWWDTEGEILVKPYVNNFEISPLGGYYMQYVWLDRESEF